jgi:hypothetical protein
LNPNIKVPQDHLFNHLFTPSDRLVGLFILHIRPTSGLRMLDVSALKIFMSNVLLCTIEVQATQWNKEFESQSTFGSVYKGLSFPALDTLISVLELQKMSPELSYLLFTELEQAIRLKPLLMECGTVVSDTNHIHFYARREYDNVFRIK